MSIENNPHAEEITKWERIVDAFHELARGNPLYLEEVQLPQVPELATTDTRPEPHPDNGWSGSWD